MDGIAALYPTLFSARQRLRAHATVALLRLRTQEALSALLVSGAVSVCVLLVALLADRYFSLSKAGINVWILWGGITALGVPYILWRVFTPKLHERLAAVLADDRLRLQARLCTALTLDLQDERAAEFSAAFFAEALGRLEKLNLRQAFPVRVPRAFALLLVPLAACVAVCMFMPYQDRLGLLKGQEEKRKAETQRQKAAALLEGKLEDLRDKLKDSADEKAGVFKVNQLLAQAGDVAKDLRDGKRNPEEAMLALGQLKREIQEEKDKLTKGKEFLDRLEKLKAKDLGVEESALTKEVAEALKMGDAALAAEKLRKMAQEIKKDVLDDPSKSSAQKEEQLKQLQREVERLAGALAEDEALSEGLRELSEKVLSAADYQKLKDEIKKQQEKQGKGSKQKGSEIEQQIEEVAEELERLEEDNDANLDEDEKDEMDKLDNVEDAIDEALDGLANPEAGEGEKGKSADGGKPGSKSGGKLGKGKKGQDAKAKNGRAVRGRAGKGSGQLGGRNAPAAHRQVDGKSEDEEKKQVQPGPGGNQGGPGMGARPHGEVADPGFVAEKVRGKLQQGAITGLSHFRGQGAKGDAPTEFVKALKAAEQETSSSLELERIPADAREVVKDYFLKVREGANIKEEPAPVQPGKKE
ncbi:MAG: hypothetical protein ABSE73_22900 [Planctomycetota bacterium]